MRGRVKFYIPARNYGFITYPGEDNRDREMFFHTTGIAPGNDQYITGGVVVTFDTEDTHKGPKAVNIKVYVEDLP